MCGIRRVVVCGAFLLLSVGRAQPPRNIRIVAVTEAADFHPGLAQAGSLSSLFVTGLEGGAGMVTPSTLPLPKELNGVTVSIDADPAPILAVAFRDGYQQINIQVPWEAQTPRVVTVAQNGVQGQTSEFGPASSESSIFLVDADGYAVVQRASDYSLITPLNPAHPGETLVAYAQNLGPVTNRPSTGAPSPLIPLAYSITPPSTAQCLVIQQVTLRAPGYSWSVPYLSVMTPGLVGVYQVAFTLPQSTPVADLHLAIYRDAFEMSGMFAGGCRGVHRFAGRSARLPVR